MEESAKHTINNIIKNVPFGEVSKRKQEKSSSSLSVKDENESVHS